MKFGIVVFPGSNCDHDAYHAVKEVLGAPAELLWHKDRTLKDADVVVLPGGFSYGDYLRCGAIARFSPVMDEVIDEPGASRSSIGEELENCRLAWRWAIAQAVCHRSPTGMARCHHDFDFALLLYLE